MASDQSVMEAKRIGVLSCGSEDTLFTVARRMVAEDVSAIVVLNGLGALVGIISRTDLLRAGLESNDWRSEHVEDFMNPSVITVPQTASLREVAQLLLEQRIHRVVVVREENDQKKPISVISAADLVYHMVRQG